MLHRVKVLCCVLVLRGVTATHVPAHQALTQMHPRIAHLDAFLAAFRVARGGARHIFEVQVIEVMARHFVHILVFELTSPVTRIAFCASSNTRIPRSATSSISFIWARV